MKTRYELKYNGFVYDYTMAKNIQAAYKYFNKNFVGKFVLRCVESGEQFNVNLNSWR